ncbi:hypothetical protein E4T44_07667 [Aureobasidium sp. EXF-8845]|nr:hypothetical protein E4T44_07667 [Aureobasidium sp. EXF-8845]KAI4844401.1 hypothetical protein E4T45_08169 [Aureobasidium sp. EXF-8846]
MASIWYANGTAVDVVKLEGGAAYKQVMRSANVRIPTPTSSDKTTRGLLGFMSLQDYLPSWAAAEPVDPDAEAITWMLEGLKAATEARVEEPLTAVSISCPFLIRSPYSFENTLRTTVESLGLNYKNTRTAAIAITELYGLEGQCDPDPYKTPDQKEKPDDPAKTYLALDHSRAGLAAFLIEEDCGVTEVLREYHNTTLAADVDFLGKRADLSRTLENFIRSTDERDSVAVSHKHPVEISDLVMLGELTEDVMLHEALLEVFGASYADLKAGNDERARLHNPLFAGSRAIAMICQKQLELELTHEWDEGFQGWLLKDTPEERQK